MTYSRFHSLHPRTSLRRLKTALAPSSPTSSTTSPTTSSASPLSTTTRGSSNFSGFNFDFLNTSTVSLSSSPQRPRTAGRALIRRKKSMVEVEQEEEREVFKGELVGLVEPRPRAGVSLGGIEEVLEGRI